MHAAGHLLFLQSTVNVSEGLPVADIMKTLTVGGHLITVGAPEEQLPAFSAFSLITTGASIGGSLMYVLLSPDMTIA